MKSRTLISFCQRPGSKPSQAISRAPFESFGFAAFTSFTAFVGFAPLAVLAVLTPFAAFAAFAALAFALAVFALAAITIPSLVRRGYASPSADAVCRAIM